MRRLGELVTLNHVISRKFRLIAMNLSMAIKEIASREPLPANQARKLSHILIYTPKVSLNPSNVLIKLRLTIRLMSSQILNPTEILRASRTLISCSRRIWIWFRLRNFRLASAGGSLSLDVFLRRSPIAGILTPTGIHAHGTDRVPWYGLCGVRYGIGMRRADFHSFKVDDGAISKDC